MHITKVFDVYVKVPTGDNYLSKFDGKSEAFVDDWNMKTQSYLLS